MLFNDAAPLYCLCHAVVAGCGDAWWCHELIRRNTRIPTFAQQLNSTVEDNQDHVDVTIFEGERATTNKYNKLGEFRLEGIMPMLRGLPRI